MKRALAFLAIAALAFGQKREVTVAAAANLSDVFQKIGPEFEMETGIHPVFSYASTAQLAAQIENGAPFDVFAAADTAHVVALDQKGLIAPNTRAVYAVGILALWFPKGNGIKLEDLGQLKVIALAKPELAPYGLAAKQTLEKLGIWSKVEPKIVYADNISMAKQYGTSGNADAVFTAYSLVLNVPGKVIQIDEALHAPIEQAVGVIAASKNQAAGLAFEKFLIAAMAHTSGYRSPSSTDVPR